MNLTQKVTAWTKACWELSILETRAVKAHIKPQKVGYMCPDETINFSNAKFAREYSKNRAIAALKDKNPYERLLIVDKNRVLDEIDGEAHRVTFEPILYAGSSNLSAIHGHPDSYAKGCASPISPGDASCILHWKHLNETIAYNTKGEFSALKKSGSISSKGWFSNLKKKFKELINTINSETIRSHYDKKIIPPERLKKLNENNRKIADCMKRKGSKDELFALIDEQNKLGKIIEEALVSEAGCKQTHKYWLKYAKKFNLEYTTNFSNL